ncbi:FecR family protein [Neotamlana sedimentorum]|uniref:FecR family protein n=1 Tax=Neotamlana sedimentorum TaxID=1435349 RepID=UPI00069A2B8D|nr:FecR family protein [Tamlana sedimentorum]
MDDKFSKNNVLARWLDNRLEDSEKMELESNGELNDLKVVLDDIDTWQVEKFDVEKGLADLNKRKKLVISPAPTKQSKSASWLKIAAAIVVLLTAGFVTFNYFINAETTIKTAVAETKTINLPDGSVVKMDALSSISFKEKDWEHNRNIELNGQAFFDVTKGERFNVITNSGSIQVLGTQFNVNTNNTIFEVKCYEGKVKVTYNNDAEILTKGHAAIAKANKLVHTTHNAKSPEWLDGFSKYFETNLLQVATDLEKYYDINIELPETYHNLQFTGTVPHNDLNTALQTLFSSMEINYTISGKTIIVD